MTIERLNEVLAYKNLEKICKALEELGYRHASKNGKWEFSPIDVAKAGKVENADRHEDIFDDKTYVGDIHAHVEGQGDYEFIVITVNTIYRDKDNLEFPCEMFLYTNAPINEEYEREASKILQCSGCKKKFPVRELCEVNGKLLCDDCFEKDLRRLTEKGKSKLAQKKKTKRK